MFRRKRDSVRFSGNYKSWEEAERDSTGYAGPEILRKTRAALLKVKAGEAAFERDSVVFKLMEYEFPLLAGLSRAAAIGQRGFGAARLLHAAAALVYAALTRWSHVGRSDGG